MNVRNDLRLRQHSASHLLTRRSLGRHALKRFRAGILLAEAMALDHRGPWRREYHQRCWHRGEGSLAVARGGYRTSSPNPALSSAGRIPKAGIIGVCQFGRVQGVRLNSPRHRGWRNLFWHMLDGYFSRQSSRRVSGIASAHRSGCEASRERWGGAPQTCGEAQQLLEALDRQNPRTMLALYAGRLAKNRSR